MLAAVQFLGQQAAAVFGEVGFLEIEAEMHGGQLPALRWTWMSAEESLYSQCLEA
jgi:hypothetical protein